MKKIALLFFLFSFFLFFHVQEKEKTVLVSLSLPNEYPEKYIIDLKESRITTKNFSSYFKENEVSSIVLDVSPLLKARGISPVFSFIDGRIEKNIRRIVLEYSKLLKNYGFTKEYYEIGYIGVKISSVTVSLSSVRVKEVLNQNSKIRIEAF